MMMKAEKNAVVEYLRMYNDDNNNKVSETPQNTIPAIEALAPKYRELQGDY